jgi:hypothetical protein
VSTPLFVVRWNKWLFTKGVVMSKKPHGSEHHIDPTSRGGAKTPDNTIDVPRKGFHNAYHIIFGNLFIEEIFSLIDNVWTKNGIIQERYVVGPKREIAWRKLFDRVRSAEKVKKIIKENFMKRA